MFHPLRLPCYSSEHDHLLPLLEQYRSIMQCGEEEQYSSVLMTSFAPIVECSVFLAHFSVSRSTACRFPELQVESVPPPTQVSPDIPTQPVAESFFVERGCISNKLPLQLCVFCWNLIGLKESAYPISRTANNDSWEPLHTVKDQTCHFCVTLYIIIQ